MPWRGKVRLKPLLLQPTLPLMREKRTGGSAAACSRITSNSNDFPHPNQWKPKDLRTDVNGKEFGSHAINQRLGDGQSAWVKVIRPMSQEEQFVRTLRAIPNDESSHSAEYIAGASTIFKNLWNLPMEGRPYPASYRKRPSHSSAKLR